MKHYQLCCMSFDGETKIESPIFDDENAAWEYDSDIGSKWYFYPFRFLVTPSHKTIIAVCNRVPFALGRRVATVQRIFKQCSEDPEMAGLQVEPFATEVNERLLF